MRFVVLAAREHVQCAVHRILRTGEHRHNGSFNALHGGVMWLDRKHCHNTCGQVSLSGASKASAPFMLPNIGLAVSGSIANMLAQLQPCTRGALSSARVMAPVAV